MDNLLFYALVLGAGIVIGVGLFRRRTQPAMRFDYVSPQQARFSAALAGILWNSIVFVAIVLFFIYVLKVG
ncbi:MAG: hypothetical protein AAF849_13100 [Bacteroidota bacterium]